MALNEAEGFADLGMWREAWDAIEDLPAEERATPAALRVRLRCCPALGVWDIGEHVAGVLGDGGDPDRECSARFFHALAVFYSRACQAEGARQAVKSAVEAWPDIRLALIDDEELSGPIFGPDCG